VFFVLPAELDQFRNPGLHVTESMQFRCHEIRVPNFVSSLWGDPSFHDYVTTRMTLDAKGIGMTLTGPACVSRLGG
jgi:hypothetical protein